LARHEKMKTKMMKRACSWLGVAVGSACLRLREITGGLVVGDHSEWKSLRSEVVGWASDRGGLAGSIKVASSSSSSTFGGASRSPSDIGYDSDSAPAPGSTPSPGTAPAPGSTPAPGSAPDSWMKDIEAQLGSLSACPISILAVTASASGGLSSDGTAQGGAEAEADAEAEAGAGAENSCGNGHGHLYSGDSTMGGPVTASCELWEAEWALQCDASGGSDIARATVLGTSAPVGCAD